MLNLLLTGDREQMLLLSPIPTKSSFVITLVRKYSAGLYKIYVLFLKKLF